MPSEPAFLPDGLFGLILAIVIKQQSTHDQWQTLLNSTQAPALEIAPHSQLVHPRHRGLKRLGDLRAHPLKDRWIGLMHHLRVADSHPESRCCILYPLWHSPTPYCGLGRGGRVCWPYMRHWLLSHRQRLLSRY